MVKAKRPAGHKICHALRGEGINLLREAFLGFRQMRRGETAVAGEATGLILFHGNALLECGVETTPK